MDNHFHTIYLKYKSLTMEIITDLDVVDAIKAHFPHSYFPPLATHDPISFIVMISDSIADPNGEYHFVVNRSLNNASLVCWLNTESKRCTLSNIKARNQYDKNRFLCFFCSNLFEKLIENEGFTALHCACIEKNDRVIALIGERMSGKTTAELMLLNKGYNLVSNDCALFKYNSEGQHIDVVGVIEDIFIREKSRFIDACARATCPCADGVACPSLAGYTCQ